MRHYHKRQATHYREDGVWKELNPIITTADEKSFTPFAQFLFAAKGYEFFTRKSAKPLDKWEVFEILQARGIKATRTDVENATILTGAIIDFFGVRESVNDRFGLR